ncbi:MAG: Cyclic nucleotide-binding domain (cNMP-BD) protein [Nevskia sp.]|nr:Cyclic nucleotide-binding domain (cNMP-BD) protein [Nevskia sp.]
MMVTTELAEHAIRKLFATNALGSRAPLEARTLYRLWEGTGLRRDDLAEGVRALTDTGFLQSRYHAGNCVYVLTKRPLPDGANPRERTLAGVPELDRLLAQAAERVRRDPSDSILSRRSKDKPQRGASPDKRTSAKNRLLVVLPKTVHERLDPHLELVPMPLGRVLWESGDRLNYVYFPVDCIVSLVQTMADGSSNEIAIVGNEGMVSISAALGGVTAPTRAIVLHAGFAYRLKMNALQDEFEHAGVLQRLLLRYSQALLMQVAQRAACNRHHSVEQQLCRLLLASADRLRSNRLTMTHEVVASMIGVRRVGITEAIGKLKRAGLIDCERGSITLLDRRVLAQHSCECYAVVKNEFDRLRPTLGERASDAASDAANSAGGRRSEKRAQGPASMPRAGSASLV